MSIAIQLTWIIILLGFPMAIGEDALSYFRQRLPWPAPWRGMTLASGLMLASGVAAYGIEMLIGAVVPCRVHEPKVLRKKLFRRFLTPVPLATMEEAVFRGILLDQMLRVGPSSTAWTAAAIALSAAIFSSVHFLRRSRPGKPRLQPALGLFLVGCVFGTAYVVGQRTLWLPIASHAVAILVCETTRLWVDYRGRPLWIGYPECPQCGIIGAACVAAGGAALVLLA
jgi:membrane protease YdiL (CAAX protease family)